MNIAQESNDIATAIVFRCPARVLGHQDDRLARKVELKGTDSLLPVAGVIQHVLLDDYYGERNALLPNQCRINLRSHFRSPSVTFYSNYILI